MRILQLHNSYLQPGGEDAIVRSETVMLKALGHEVETLWIENPSGPAAQAATLTLAGSNPFQARAVGRLVDSFRPDVAHIHNMWYSLTPSAVHALARAHVPIVVSLHNYRLLCANALLFRDGHICTECLSGSHWRASAHGCYRNSRPQSVVASAAMSVNAARHTWALVDRFIVPSEFVARLFSDVGFDRDRFAVHGNNTLDPGARPTPPSSSRTLVCAGRLSDEKGVDVVLDAWSEAALPDLTLDIVGDGPLRARLEARNVAGVRFRGHLSPREVRETMLGARAMVMPTQWLENFGMVCIEAMAAGLPVLASDIGTPADLVGPIGADWLVAPSDRSAWVEALRRLSSDDSGIDAAGLRARALWEQLHAPEVARHRLVGIYEDTIAEHDRQQKRASS